MLNGRSNPSFQDPLNLLNGIAPTWIVYSELFPLFLYSVAVFKATSESNWKLASIVFGECESEFKSVALSMRIELSIMPCPDIEAVDDRIMDAITAYFRLTSSCLEHRITEIDPDHSIVSRLPDTSTGMRDTQNFPSYPVMAQFHNNAQFIQNVEQSELDESGDSDSVSSNTDMVEQG